MTQRMFRFKDLNVQLNIGEQGSGGCVNVRTDVPGCLCTSDPLNNIVVSFACRFNSLFPPKYCTAFSDIEVVTNKILTSPEARTLLKQSLEQDIKLLADLDAAQNAQVQPESLEEAEMLRSKLNDALQELDAQIEKLKKTG
jgi:hypothetical protein